MGTVLSIIASMGLSGAYPYFIIKKNDLEKEQTFLFFGIPVLCAIIVFSFFFFVGFIRKSVFLIFLFTVIFALQRLLSTRLKTQNKGHIAVFIDGGYYFVLSTVICIVYCCQILDTLSVLLYALQIYSIVLSIFLILYFIRIKSFSISKIVRKELITVLSFSYKMIISGVIVYWLTSSARIYINWFLGYEDVGLYSFYFRMAGIAVALYLFIYIAFFKRLYTLNASQMDIYYSSIMIIVVIGCLLISVVIPEIANFINKDIVLDNWKLYVLLCLQMPIWVGFSLCEGIIGRENLVNQFNLSCGILVLLFPVMLYLIKPYLTINLYALISCLLFFVAYSIQLYILKRHGLSLKYCMSLNIVLLILSIGYYIIY